jgi:hypothetical protein
MTISQNYLLSGQSLDLLENGRDTIISKLEERIRDYALSIIIVGQTKKPVILQTPTTSTSDF